MLDSLALLALLIGLELVLGIDNVLVISILVERVEEKRRRLARILGLVFAMVARIAMLFLVMALTSLTGTVVLQFSVRDLILLGGGLFLIYKAVKEIHATVELKEETSMAAKGPKKSTMFAVTSQIVLLDIVFSIDSVITAVGLTDQMWVIVTAVILSFSLVLIFANVIGEFILDNPALKILALSFLITIGVTLFIEGLHQHIPKAYIYLPMGFALFVELLQLRYQYNRERLEEQEES